MSIRKLYKIKDFKQRMLENVAVDINGCWLWTGAKIKGYGATSIRKKKVLAHRAMYEIVVGEVAEGLDLDHLCRNRACINPAHLDPVTRSVNLRRGVEARGCKRGHPIEEFTLINTTSGQFHRRCKICHRERNKKCSK